MNRILILDVETSGIDPDKDHVVEVGAVLWDVTHKGAVQGKAVIGVVPKDPRAPMFRKVIAARWRRAVARGTEFDEFFVEWQAPIDLEAGFVMLRRTLGIEPFAALPSDREAYLCTDPPPRSTRPLPALRRRRSPHPRPAGES